VCKHAKNIVAVELTAVKLIAVQGMLAESTSHGDRLLYGHSQGLLIRMVIHDHHHGWGDQPGK